MRPQYSSVEMSQKIGEVLARFDFPLYTLQFIDDKHFLVAGGGGGAKTGIPNAVEVFRFHHGRVQRVLRFQPEANLAEPIMNAALVVDNRTTVLAAGMGKHCHLFSLRYKLQEEMKEGQETENEGEPVPKGETEEAVTKETTNGDLRRRKKEAKESGRGGDGGRDEGTKEKEADSKHERNGFVYHETPSQPRVSFEVIPLTSIRTDFMVSKKEGDSYQKVVRFNPSHSLFFTGGTDGHLRCWNYPSVGKEPLFCKEVHSGCDVVDLDVSPDGLYVVTIGATDAKGLVVEAKDGAKHRELEWIREDYRFRGCRYGVIPTPPGMKTPPKHYRLFTIHCPKLITSKGDNYISMWDSSRYIPVKSQPTGRDMLSTLTISDDGIFVGVGTRGGSVGIFIAFSLQKLYWVNATHAIFVTGLAFTPSTELARRHVGDYDASLVSISADNSAQIHHVPKRASISIVWVFLGCFLSIYLIFWLIAELGL